VTEASEAHVHVTAPPSAIATEGNSLCGRSLVAGEDEATTAPLDVSAGASVQVSQCGSWYRARVLEVSETASGRQALVHYLNWNRRYDEWVPLDSRRIKRPAPVRSPRNHASSAAADAAVSTNSGLEGAQPAVDVLPLTTALPQQRGANASRKQKDAPLPEGWATAAAAETLREFGERKFYAADWYNAFAAHAITKRSGESAERLLAIFVIAVNDLQMLGLCNASKRPRGTIEKRVFS
jgi:hypothetical protein